MAADNTQQVIQKLSNSNIAPPIGRGKSYLFSRGGIIRGKGRPNQVGYGSYINISTREQVLHVSID